LAWMYLASASVKRFHDDGSPDEDRPLLDWSCQLALFNIQEALRGVLDNLPSRALAWLLFILIFPIGARFRPPADRLGAILARGLIEEGPLRLRLSSNIFASAADESALSQIDARLSALLAARAARDKLKSAVQQGNLVAEPSKTMVKRALAKGIIGDNEAAMVERAFAAQDAAIQVDSFSAADYKRL
jgi:acyl-CoA dehydrogenase